MSVVDSFLVERGYSAETREKYGRVLRELVCAPGLESMSAVVLLGFVQRAEWGNSARYVALAACRSFLRWRFGAGHPALSARIKRVPPKRQRRLSADQALRLLASFDLSTAKGTRDLAIAALALDAGLRVSELCRLSMRDVDLERGCLQVVVKGGRWGSAVFSAATANIISAWLARRKARCGVDALFVSVTRGTRLTREGLQVIVRKWGARCGFVLSPHDLRRTFAVLSIQYGAPSRVVQVAGRWSALEMVEVYTRDLDQAAIRPYLPVARLLG